MNFKYSVLISLILGVSACGGGGSGGGSVASPAPSVVISTSNGSEVAANAGAGDAIPASATGGITPLSVSQPQQNAVKLTDLTLQLLHLGAGQQVQAQLVSTCPYGGSMTTPDNPSAMSGTKIYSNCGVAVGVSVDGSLTYSISGTSTNFSASVSYSNFTIINGSVVSTLNASMSIAGSSNGTVDSLSVTIPNFDLTVDSAYVKLYNYSLTGTNDTSTGAYSVSWSYTYESSFINGAVYVTTEQPLSGNDNNPYPSLGSVVVTGANKSHVRFSTNGMGTATDIVLIEFDADGDGVYESIKTMTWEQFAVLKAII
jgi:hypothetical protein